MIAFYLRGLLLGFSIAAPVGPIGVLCIRRTLAEGRLAGLVSGLGAASADAIYGSIAAFGLTFISSFLVSQQAGLRLIGGAFLVYLGLRTFFSRPAKQSTPVESSTPADGRATVKAGALLANYASTFFLTLTNPMTILSFAAIFAGLGLAGLAGSYDSAGVLVAGVFCGSALWWLLLSGLVGLFRQRFTQRSLLWVNRISGTLITLFGAIALASAI